MFDGTAKYLKGIPKRRLQIAFLVIAAGVLFPLIFAAYILSTHGSFDNVFDYEPVLRLFEAFVLAGVLVFVAAAADLFLKMRSRSKSLFPSSFTWALAVISIILAVSVASYVLLPGLIRSGDVPPQLLLTAANQSNVPGIAVAFYTEKPTANALRWGSANGTQWILREDKPSNKHWFQLNNLQPGQQYAYSLNGNNSVEFRTPSADGLHFAASGDPHFGAEASRNDLTRLMLKDIANPANSYSMFFLLGDAVQFGFFDALWKQAFNSMATASSSIPTAYVLGNHDAMFGGVEFYKDYLCPPGLSSVQGQCLTKRIDNGNVHFLILDVEWQLQTYTPEQKQWLQQQLASIPKSDWCIVMSHTFYYSSGSFVDGWAWYDNQATISELTPLFENSSVDLVLSGHKHHSEVLQKNNITYVVLGAFGGPPDAERQYVSPASIWYAQGKYAFADVTIHGDNATLVIRDPGYAELFKTEIQNRK
ncbi:MAG: metallophosphoesterase [Candidatus Micrarchaeota archaeon]